MKAMSPLRMLVVLAAILAVGAEPAAATTVRIQGIYDKAAWVADGLYLRGQGDEDNDVRIVRQGSVVTVADSVPLDPGAGCEALSADEVRCTIAHQFLSLVLDVRLGDGDDALTAAGVEATSAKLYGGRGDDHLIGPSILSTRFHGGPGNDLMEGGSGGDTFLEDAERNGSDTMLGGPPGDPRPGFSDDNVDYRLRQHPIHADADGDRDDGEARERDRIGADVEQVVGGLAADVMVGNALPNRFVGGPGRDLLLGGAGDDHLIGDEYVTDPKREEDEIRGGPGDDRLEGGRGVDRVSGGTGHDSIVAGPGADRLRTRDGVLDAVLCGGGRDRVLHDGADFLADDCERQGSHIPARVVPLFWADGGDRLFLALGCPFHRRATCEAEATLEVEGRLFGPRSFSLAPGRYAWLLLSLGERTKENPSPPLEGGVLVLRSADARGRVATVRIALSAVHRDPTEVSFFLPPVLPFL
jgi:hypothetical protein